MLACCTNCKETGERYMREGKELMAESKDVAASVEKIKGQVANSPITGDLKNFLDTIKKEPTNVTALLGAAKALSARAGPGDLEQAIEHAKSAAQQQATDGEAKNLLDSLTKMKDTIKQG